MQEIVIDPMMVKLCQVKKVRKETHDTVSLDLVFNGENDAFSFCPGQFNMLYIYGVGEVPISISSNPSKTGSLTHTVRVVGAVTKAMRNLKKGDPVGLRGPFGTSWPVQELVSQDIVIIAGGIALAPLRPAIYEIITNRKKFRKVFLLYGARTQNDILYTKELEEWHNRFNIEVGVTVDVATKKWKGDVGVVTKLIYGAHFDPASTTALICGPEVMMRFAIYDMLDRGVAEENIVVSMERNMKCGIGLCGHCQCGPYFICKDGPVFRYSQVKKLFMLKEV